MLHPIEGYTHPRFEEVRDTFAENFQLRGELGASFCVWHRGERVVDLAGGYRDRLGERRWTAESLTTIFSVTKGVVAACFLMLFDRGLIDYDDPIAQYWPELSEGPEDEPLRGARRGLTIRQLLEHRSGLLGFRAPLTLETLEDEPALLSRLEREPLRWEPGSRQGYHGVTFGLYAGALFKKITRRSLGDFLRDEVAGPLRADLYLGLNEDEERALESRLCPIFPNQPRDLLLGVLPELLLKPSVEGRFYRSAVRKSSDTALAFGQPAALGARGLNNFNTARVRRLELPWSNAQSSARGIAQLYQGLITPQRLVSGEQLSLLKPIGSWSERDAVIGKPLGFTLGFQKEEPHLFSPTRESFGHPGAGGALGWADPEHQLAIGYVMNRMGHHVRSPRAIELCHAVYRCLS